jgi:hypothetical protein
MGAYIATGLFNIGINDENFTAYALFNEQIYSDKYYDRLGKNQKKLQKLKKKKFIY